MQIHELTQPQNELRLTFDIASIQNARAKVTITPDNKRALFVTEKSRPDFVFNTAALEGNPFTFPEVKTLIEGITVGGHKQSDADQVLNINKALTYMVNLVRTKAFRLDKPTACAIQNIVAREEALAWGEFRSGNVFIDGTEYLPPPHSELDQIFAQGSQYLHTVHDPVLRAFLVFLWGSLQQFFYDGNKRTSRLLANGILLEHGYPPIIILAKDALQYNINMCQFYDTQDATQMIVWLCEYYQAQSTRLGFPH